MTQSAINPEDVISRAKQEIERLVGPDFNPELTQNFNLPFPYYKPTLFKQNISRNHKFLCSAYNLLANIQYAFNYPTRFIIQYSISSKDLADIKDKNIVHRIHGYLELIGPKENNYMPPLIEEDIAAIETMKEEFELLIPVLNLIIQKLNGKASPEIMGLLNPAPDIAKIRIAECNFLLALREYQKQITTPINATTAATTTTDTNFKGLNKHPEIAVKYNNALNTTAKNLATLNKLQSRLNINRTKISPYTLLQIKTFESTIASLTEDLREFFKKELENPIWKMNLSAEALNQILLPSKPGCLKSLTTKKKTLEAFISNYKQKLEHQSTINQLIISTTTLFKGITGPFAKQWEGMNPKNNSLSERHIEQAQKACEFLITEIQKLTTETEKLAAIRDEITKFLEKTRRESMILRTAINTAEKVEELNELQKQTAELVERVTSFVIEINKTNLTKEELFTFLNLKAEYEDHIATIKNFKSTIASELPKAIAEKHCIIDLSNNKQGLEDKIAETKPKIFALNLALDETTKELNKLTKETEETQAQIASNDNKILETNRHMSILAQQQNESQKSSEKIEEERLAIQQNIDAFQLEQNKLQENIAAITTKIKTLTSVSEILSNEKEYGTFHIPFNEFIANNINIEDIKFALELDTLETGEFWNQVLTTESSDTTSYYWAYLPTMFSNVKYASLNDLQLILDPKKEALNAENQQASEKLIQNNLGIEKLKAQLIEKTAFAEKEKGIQSNLALSHAQLTADNTALTKQNDILRPNISALENQISSLSDKIEKKRMELSKLTQNLANLEITHEKLAQETAEKLRLQEQKEAAERLRVQKEKEQKETQQILAAQEETRLKLLEKQNRQEEATTRLVNLQAGSIPEASTKKNSPRKTPTATETAKVDNIPVKTSPQRKSVPMKIIEKKDQNALKKKLEVFAKTIFVVSGVALLAVSAVIVAFGTAGLAPIIIATACFAAGCGFLFIGSVSLAVPESKIRPVPPVESQPLAKELDSNIVRNYGVLDAIAAIPTMLITTEFFSNK